MSEASSPTAEAAPKELLVGGQAVLEGVMMKLPRSWAVTVRRQNGELATRQGPFVPWSDRWPILKLPILRGGAVLLSTLVLGMRSLFFSSDIMAEDMEAAELAAKDQPDGSDDAKGKPGLMTLSLLLLANALSVDVDGSECDSSDDGPEGEDGKAGASTAEPQGSADSSSEEPKKSGGLTTLEIAGTLAFTLLLGIGIFKLLPLLAARGVAKLVPALDTPLAESAISGLALLCLFVAYLYFISLQKDIKRVFQYHGAEHKVVWLMEKGQEQTVENAREHSTFHPRCGTSFLFFMVVTSILIWALFPVPWGILGKLALRIALLPLIVGVSFELIRFTARHQTRSLFRVMIAPGLWSQRITTKPPDDGMLEVSLHSLALAEAEEHGRQAQIT